MLFSGILFLVYFLPLFWVGYYLVNRPWRNAFVLLASTLFYAWGAPMFIYVVLCTTLLDFWLVGRMAAAPTPFRKNLYFGLSLGLNLGLLAVFKYANFFVENVNALTEAAGIGALPWTAITLPLGVSFFTFESLTYVIDVYRGQQQPLRRFWDYQLYILFFPKLLMGPIVRYQDIAAQLADRSSTETVENFLHGFFRFCLGLGKKVIIASPLAAFAQPYMASQLDALSPTVSWFALIAYSFQIYFDFSGYSDIALGLAQMMGFRLPENFDTPYLSRTPGEFWRRWHISLGTWLRQYLYIPLGGSRGSTRTTYRNLWIVFIACGLWHGATWPCLLWGIWHGLFMTLDRLFLGEWLERMPRWVGRLSTWFIIMFCLGLFELDTLAQCGVFYSSLFGAGGGSIHLPQADVWFSFFLALLFILLPALNAGQRLMQAAYTPAASPRGWLLQTGLALLLFLLCMSLLSWAPYNAFLYLRF